MKSTLSSAGLLCFLSAASSISFASTLPADTLVCENEAQIAVVATEGWKGKTATALLKTAAQSAEFYRLSNRGAQVRRNLAINEEAIRADSSRLAPGSTAARAQDAADASTAALTEAEKYERIGATCGSSGPEPVAADLTAARPISRLSKVKMKFNGAVAELWVRSGDLID